AITMRRVRPPDLAKLALLAAAFSGAVLPPLGPGGPGPSAARAGEGPDPAALVRQALQAAAGIQEGQDKAFVLRDLARFQLRDGAREAAEQAARQAIRSGRAIPSPVRRAWVLAEGTPALAEAGDRAAARGLLQESLTVARDRNRKAFPTPRPPPGTRPPSLLMDPADLAEIGRLAEAIAGAQAEVGDYDGAFRTLDE